MIETTTTLKDLDPASRVWVFASHVEISGEKHQRLRGEVSRFLEGWRSHGVLLPARCEILHGHFLVVAADPRTDPSGCSIDGLFRLLQKLSTDLELPLLESQWVYYRAEDGKVNAVSQGEFKQRAERDEIDENTVVFDTNIDSASGLSADGSWEKRVGDSWHAKLLEVG